MPRKGALRRIAGWLALVAALVILVGLGTWQVQRLHWKEGLIAMMAERRAAPAVPLAEIEAMMARGEAIDYRPVEVSGQFDHSRERHFLATLDGQPGFDVYTPLTLDDGRIVFINRGFVPETLRDRDSRKAGLPEGRVSINGLAREKLSAKPGSMVPDNDPAKNMFFWKDLDSMAKSVGLEQAKILPLFIDAGPNADPALWPRGGITIFDLPNNHLQYALTWYGLALALLAVVIVSAVKKRKIRGSEDQ